MLVLLPLTTHSMSTINNFHLMDTQHPWCDEFYLFFLNSWCQIDKPVK